MEEKNERAGLIAISLFFLGLWLVAYALTFKYSQPSLFYTDLILGLLLTLFIFVRKNVYFLFAAFIGVVLQLTPLIFWTKDLSVYINDTLVGVAAIILGMIIPSYHKQISLAPVGWGYNPSVWRERFPIMFFSFLAFAFARYMAAFQLGLIDTMWDPVFVDGTQKVITSAISKSFPVSDAGMGAFAYVIEFLMTCHGGISRWHTHPWFVLLFGFVVIPVGIVSMILIALQPLAVGAWCFWCLATAFCMLLMAYFAFDEVLAAIKTLRGEKAVPLD